LRDTIFVKGAREHNLKNIDVVIPRDQLIVITGLSGSGKSSLAFDTIYAEGQRRYVESLSSYARQFLGQMEKPDVDYIEGLSPAISIDQKTTSRNPRSTVGTVTEIYDYLRLLYARIGVPHCPECGREIERQTVDQMVDAVMKLDSGTRIMVLAPVVRGRKGEYRKLLDDLLSMGYVRARVDGQIVELSDDIKLGRYNKHTIEVVIDRLVISGDIDSRLSGSLETALKLAEGLAVVNIVEGGDLLFSSNYACPECGIALEEITPRMFSFNNPYGACPSCSGLGTIFRIDPELVIDDWSLSLADGAVKVGGFNSDNMITAVFGALAKKYGFSVDTPLRQLEQKHLDVLFYGTGGEKLEIEYTNSYGTAKYSVPFEGVINTVDRRYKQTTSKNMKEYYESLMSTAPCPDCEGRRLRKEALAVTVGGLSIAELTAMTIRDSKDFINNLRLNETQKFIADQIIRELNERLGFLNDVGLSYLTLSRTAGTLSGGEAQRIRLATQIGSSLMGVLYILDEPSIGLHQRDNARLLSTLKRLRDLGNTLVVVEHDEETMLSADYIIDMGPGPGIHGGEVVSYGTPGEIMADDRSLTGQFLVGKRSIKTPENRRAWQDVLTIRGARQNNLKNIDVDIPLGVLTCVTGVSGSGKSSLINEILYKSLARDLNRAKSKPGLHDRIDCINKLDKVIDIDQSPIGRTPRSNPATYTGTFSLIRDLFSNTMDSRAKGYGPGRFSFNVKGGRCEACKGDGIIKIEMHFLPDVYVPCEVCKGKRYNNETLSVRYKGKNIYEVLDMNVENALEFFENVPAISTKLQTLYDVGLGYIKLGQPSTQLSGGEAQRIKLATELSRRSTGQTLYMLDEPTTGLHMADVEKLLAILQELVDAGNTVVVIEHNMDVIKSADHIIDLGPEGGDGGGLVVASGTPEEIAMIGESHTGEFLRKYMNSAERYTQIGVLTK